MRKYTATQDELEAYFKLKNDIANIQTQYDAIRAQADLLQQELADTEAQIAAWDQAHGEDVPDVI